MAKKIFTVWIRSSSLLAVLLYVVCSTSLQAQGTDWRRQKAAYEEQAGQAVTDYDTKVLAVKRTYREGLEGLDAKAKRACDLDTLLAVRKELARFKEADSLGADDMASPPSDLATLQHKYTTSLQAAQRDREARIVKAATAYVAQLEQTRRQLVQQDKLADALEVQREQDRIRSAVDLKAPETNSVAPATPIAPTNTTTVSGPDSSNSRILKPAKGFVWVYALERDAGVKGLRFYLQTEPDGKAIEAYTESQGKAIFKTDNASVTYRLILLSDQYARVDLPGLKEGDAPTIKLQASPTKHGFVEVRNKGCNLPEIGKLVSGGTWSSSNGEHGTALRPENARVKVISSHGSAKLNINRNNGNVEYGGQVFMMGEGRTATFQLGDVAYDVRVIMINDHTFLEYTRH